MVVTAWAVWSGATVVALTTVLLAVRVIREHGVAATTLAFPGALLMLALGYVTVGCFLGSRLPRHPVGWLLAAWGAVMTLTALFAVHEVAVLAAGPPTALLAWTRWGWAALWHPAFVLLFLLLLLFPDGHLPSPRWRHVARFAVAWYALLAVASALSTEGVSLVEAGPVAPPAVVPTHPLADALVAVLLPGQLVLLVVAVVGLVHRLRRATGRQRSQIAWFVYAVTLAVLAFAAGVALFGGGVLFPVFLAIPMAAAYAVLRQRLYDIERVVRRTVAYTVLAGILAAVYAGAVLTLQWVIPASGSDLAVAVSTLLAAALVRPVRRRVQVSVDRRFDRSPYDAATTIDDLAARLRDEVDTDAVRAALQDVVAASVRPVSVTVWVDADTN
jgi:hypothetical protein